MKFRKGDVVSVIGTVEYDLGAEDDKLLFVKMPGEYRSLALSLDQLSAVTLVQAKFEIGERVMWSGKHGFGVIVSIHDDVAWIKQDDAGYETCYLHNLSREP